MYVPSEMQAIFGHTIKPSPDEIIKSHYKYAHHAYPQGYPGKIADCGHFCDVAAEAVRFQGSVAPSHVFGDYAGIP